MKKIFYLFSILAMGAMVASCELNDLPAFDDKDAFAAFPNASMKIAEDGGTLNIPVHVTSLKGVATTVTYEFVNGSAVQGVDFEDASGTGSITFAAGESEKNIVVKILPHLGTFTGDRAFSVRFKSTGDAKMGASNSCNVTINDIDHPLSSILGTYTASGVADASGDEYDFSVTFSKDPSDVSKIWISNLDPYFASYGYVAPNYNYIYGIVNDDVTLITVPRQQSTGYQTVVFEGLDDADPELAGSESDILIEIRDGGAKLVILNAFGTADDGEFWSLYPGGLVLTK